jgi:recombination protein RecA
MAALANKIRATFKDSKKAEIISTGSNMWTPTEDSDFVVMPDWFKQISGIKGLPFGFVVQIAGTPDSGKTSFAITAIKAAQEQDIVVILADTEQKTTKSRLENWGVSPDNLALLRPSNLEEMYDGIDLWIEAIKDSHPDKKILVVIDSVGNTPSAKEVESEVEDTLQLGLAAKVNKRGLRRLASRLKKENIAMLLINQTYNNLGSPGKSNTGGEAINFFSALTYQTSRKAWIEKVSEKENVRVGAVVKWTLYKNHFCDDMLLKTAEIRITSTGMRIKDVSQEE